MKNYFEDTLDRLKAELVRDIYDRMCKYGVKNEKLDGYQFTYNSGAFVFAKEYDGSPVICDNQLNEVSDLAELMNVLDTIDRELKMPKVPYRICFEQYSDNTLMLIAHIHRVEVGQEYLRVVYHFGSDTKEMNIDNIHDDVISVSEDEDTNLAFLRYAVWRVKKLKELGLIATRK